MIQRKTLTEQIEAARDELRQQENRLKNLIQKQKSAERNARTKRLIERGAILESLIDGAESFTNEQIQMLLKTTLSTSAAREILTVFLNENTAKTSENSQESVN